MKTPELEELTKLDSTASPEEVAKMLNEDGAVVVENLVAPEILDQIQHEIDPHLPTAMTGKTEGAGFHTRRLSGLVVKSPTFAEFLLHPLLLGVSEQILLPNAAVSQLAMTQYIEIGPGETTQVPHRDDVIYGVPDPHPQFEYLFVLALSDFTEDNGATRIGKWAHQHAPDRVARPEEMVGGTMSAG